MATQDAALEDHVVSMDGRYGATAPDRDGGSGAHVFRITALELS